MDDGNNAAGNLTCCFKAQFTWMFRHHIDMRAQENLDRVDKVDPVFLQIGIPLFHPTLN